MEQIAQANPDTIVALFIGGIPGPTRSSFYKAQLTGNVYCPVMRNRIVHVVALLWPRARAESFLLWVQVSKIPGHNPPLSDDAVVGFWAQQTQQPIVATVPSLVQHEDVVPSTVSSAERQGKNRNRVAVGFIGDADPLELDWRNVTIAV